MSSKTIYTPINEDTTRSLNVGDIVTITGHVFGMRDKTLIHMFDKHHDCPVNVRGYPVLHTAPSLKKKGCRWEKIIIGTTTSVRMNRFTVPLMQRYGVSAIIGKSGLYQDSLEAMSRFGGCYLAIVGGAAALETTQIEEVEEVYWPQLHPEAIYKFRVKDLGPLIVAMDSHGQSLYDDVRATVSRRLYSIYRKLGITPQTSEKANLSQKNVS